LLPRASLALLQRFSVFARTQNAWSDTAESDPCYALTLMRSVWPNPLR
jgi:hypothetical protein